MTIHEQMNNNEKNRTQKAKRSRMRNRRQAEEHTDSSTSSRLHHRERKRKNKIPGSSSHYACAIERRSPSSVSPLRCFCRALSSPSVRPSVLSSRIPSSESADSSRVLSPVSAESSRVLSPVSAESSRVPSPVSADSSGEPFSRPNLNLFCSVTGGYVRVIHFHLKFHETII